MTAAQLILPGAGPDLPDGLAYRPDFLGPDEERTLAARIAGLELKPFEFHGFQGNRRTASFGWHYASDGSGLREAAAIPDWLLPVRARAAALVGLPAEALEQVLLIEYAPDAGIGWHRDRPVFGDVVGISLLAPAWLRFRRRRGEKMGAILADSRAALGLCPAGRGAPPVGAQHPGDGRAALLDHVPESILLAISRGGDRA